MKVSVFMLRNSVKSRSAFIFLISCNLFRILGEREVRKMQKRNRRRRTHTSDRMKDFAH